MCFFQVGTHFQDKRRLGSASKNSQPQTNTTYQTDHLLSDSDACQITHQDSWYVNLFMFLFHLYAIYLKEYHTLLLIHSLRLNQILKIEFDDRYSHTCFLFLYSGQTLEEKSKFYTAKTKRLKRLPWLYFAYVLHSAHHPCLKYLTKKSCSNQNINQTSVLFLWIKGGYQTADI